MYPEIKDRLTGWGLDEGELTTGKSLYEEAEISLDAKDEERDKQVGVSGLLGERFVIAISTFQGLRKLVRIVVGNDKNLLAQLGLRDALKGNFKGLVRQGKQFYRRVLGRPEVLALQATLDRDNVFEELSIWLSAFYQVCRMVFHSGPDRQMLERLGIPAITSRPRKSRKKPKEEKEESSRESHE
ncbi:MAG: hypothetical protein GY940_38155 [bacterium]|nr:hypothetical protein [bacterium]